MRTILSGLVLGLSVCAPVGAATIAWQAPQTISGDADVVNLGNSPVGYNFAGGAATVNGVDFVAAPIDPGSTTATGGNVVLTSGSAGTLQSFGGFGPAAGGAISAAYSSVLTDAIYNEATGQAVPFTIAISGLTVGDTYQVQYFVNDSRDCCSFRSVELGGSPTATLDYNTADANGGLGQYAIGTFTADAATQSFTATGLPTAAGSTQISALTVQLVPEPTALGLAAAAMGCLGLARRRR